MSQHTQGAANELADELELPYWNDGTPHGQLVKAAAMLRKQANRIEQLERENAELRKDAERLNFACEVYEKDIKFLKNENEANERNLCQLTDDLAVAMRRNGELRKDAARLDFYAVNTSKIVEVIGTWYHRKGYGKMARKAHSLRAAIDAVMQKEQS